MVANHITPQITSSWSDADLVDAAAAGSTTAWNLLLERHERTFFRLAMSVVKDEAAANDVVQVAFLSIFSKIDSFHGRGSFSSWANRVVYNAALMHLRKNKRRREVALEAVAPEAGDFDAPADDASFAGFVVSPDKAYADRQLGEHILNAIEQLAPKYRQIIELREFRGLTMEELGEALGLSIGGAKTRLHRARDFLRVNLSRHYPELAA